MISFETFSLHLPSDKVGDLLRVWGCLVALVRMGLDLGLSFPFEDFGIMLRRILRVLTLQNLGT